MNRRRGTTLIECMIAVAVIGICAGMWGHFEHYERRTQRAAAREGLVRVLDMELERIRTCADRACVERDAPRDDADTWARAEIARTVAPGPDGTLLVTLKGTLPGMGPPIELSGLVRIAR